MSRFLFSLLSLPIGLCSTGVCKITDCFDNAILLKTYSNGSELVMNEEELKSFSGLFEKAMEGANILPSYCISLHQETSDTLQTGIWARFIFSGIQNCGSMQFCELLIKIEKNITGINVIRSNFGYLETRCYYLDLENNFDELYDFLNGLQKVSMQSPVENPYQENEIADIKIETIYDENEVDEKDDIKNQEQLKQSEIIEENEEFLLENDTKKTLPVKENVQENDKDKDIEDKLNEND